VRFKRHARYPARVSYLHAAAARIEVTNHTGVQGFDFAEVYLFGRTGSLVCRQHEISTPGERNFSKQVDRLGKEGSRADSLCVKVKSPRGS
jgi:hypothetical protein